MYPIYILLRWDLNKPQKMYSSLKARKGYKNLAINLSPGNHRKSSGLNRGDNQWPRGMCQTLTAERSAKP